MEKIFPLHKGWRSATVSALLNHVINGALGHHTDSAAGGGEQQYGAKWKCWLDEWI